MSSRERHSNLGRASQSNRPSFDFSDEAKRMVEHEPPKEGFVLKRSCASCVQFDTCLIWRLHADNCKTINEQLERGDNESKIEPIHFATICPLYLSRSDIIGGR
jgi:hypothetical protein